MSPTNSERPQPDDAICAYRDIDLAWCAEVIAFPLRRETQPDGRVRFWGEIVMPGETVSRFLRVVTLADGETIHNAFFDRRFRKDIS